ncbi:DNA-protecting protein DprA [Photobacterium angustum]|uniref:DNA-protecting protein DprA n=1 Tax=Photobacterium angustum TaxID=661 RepID=A0A855S737_PHOAN|nr:DNA-processing protein DprA [Photobacterium angustum]KJF80190.1 DNA processing protein DprA [Photobacterium damselae subsp. damselae]KJG28096.1 DNA processing protein DprA [Photobacterium angustum]KJG36459.1 DNA processing protein DprA [Photobacterium angustum]KJG43650.1 DNA processing protein DprA [Photobacterium angustum]KJG45857.1 DNA processing protein DprA [Photobacterium angustum]
MSEALYPWLVLAMTPNLGGYRINKLLRHISAQQCVSSSFEQLFQLGLTHQQATAITSPNQQRIDQALRWQQHPDQHILTLDSPTYPYLLKQISSPPPLLFVRGEVAYLAQPQVAIIGSRAASIDGREAAFNFGYALGQAEYVVTSGLALGIDGQAHLGALKSGGATVAVLGSGLDQVYPARHRQLANEIVEQGALVSEFWPDEKPRPQNFPRRNRVISGLSTGVLVVEAAEKSGSLITARYALEQGREVFALPGSIYNAQSRGCNALIKSGAKLVESPADIFNEVGTLTECAINNQIGLPLPQPENEELPFPALLANVGTEATPVDVVAERCEQPVHEVLTQLLELELLGLVSAVPGGYVRTRRS